MRSWFIIMIYGYGRERYSWIGQCRDAFWDLLYFEIVMADNLVSVCALYAQLQGKSKYHIEARVYFIRGLFSHSHIFSSIWTLAAGFQQTALCDRTGFSPRVFEKSSQSISNWDFISVFLIIRLEILNRFSHLTQRITALTPLSDLEASLRDALQPITALDA